MGYASQSKLGEVVAKTFAQYLRNGRPIVEAFFYTGHYAETQITTDHHIYKIMYIPQAKNETIYTPYVRYEYDSSEVIVQQYDIFEELS